ncbi:hypothetical protein MMC28_008782 [Mycoblastus sanguinarius]|nr:hypothetical protein [Mycoblastus sanguinarius]
MGLIKTAMMSGAGIYAVNKLAKTAERRNDSSSQAPTNNNSQYDSRGYPPQGQGYWGPPPPNRQQQQPQSRDTNDRKGDGYPPQGYWYPYQPPNNEQSSTPPPYAQQQQQVGYAPQYSRNYEPQQTQGNELARKRSNSSPFEPGRVIDYVTDAAEGVWHKEGKGKRGN